MELYKKGSRGEVVKQIQLALNLYPDGIYGSLTEEAVRIFQIQQGLKPDGVVGPATLAKLIPCRWKKSKRRITEIIIHCSATPEYKNYTAADIRRWHKQQGWSDIGYHFVIQLDGTIEEGRHVDVVGAHCNGHNQRSIGVCYIGGVAADGRTPKDTRTELQKNALLSLLIDLKGMYPGATIYGHHDFDKGKACPSFDARCAYSRL